MGKRAFIFFSIISASVYFTACSESKTKIENRIKDKLSAFEKNLSQNKKDTAALHELEEMISDFEKKYPDDSASAKFTYELAGKQWQSGEIEKALKNYERLAAGKISNIARTSLNDAAIIYLTDLNNTDKAKELFQQYLDKYKGQDAEETKMVEAELETAGKSVEEIMKGWNK